MPVLEKATKMNYNMICAYNVREELLPSNMKETSTDLYFIYLMLLLHWLAIFQKAYRED